MDAESRKALSNFLLAYLDVGPSQMEGNLVSVIGIRYGLKMLLDDGVFMPDGLAKAILRNSNVLVPAHRILDFVNNGKWPIIIDGGFFTFSYRDNVDLNNASTER